MTTTARRLTLDEFLALPETKPYSEFVDGEVVQKGDPTLAHSRAQGTILMLLYRFMAHGKLGEALPSWTCIFGPSGREWALTPDVTVALNDKVPVGDARDHPYLLVAPDIVVEVVSTDELAGPFAEKIEFYRDNGARLIWVLDPERETARVHAPGQPSRLLLIGDTLDGGDVLPGFSIALDDLFAPLRSVRG